MCKACTGKQRAAKSVCAKQAKLKSKEYDAENDCPGNAPGQRSSAILMEQQCGADFATLVDVIDVPPQYVAAVIVRTAIEPNTSAQWAESASAPNCSQVFFFDTRRTVRELEKLLADVYYLNHTMTMAGMPTFARIVPRAVAVEKCQCGRDNCRADEHRAALVERRSCITPVRSMFTLDGGKSAAPHVLTPNICHLTSGDCDEDVTGIYLDADTMPIVVDAPTTRVKRAPALRYWHLYDSVSGAPILPADSNADSALNGDDFLFIGSTLYRALKFDTSIDAQAASLFTDLKEGGMLMSNPLTLGSLNVDEVMRCRRSSVHSAPICWHDEAKQMCKDLIQCNYGVEDMVQDAACEAKRCLNEESTPDASDDDDDDEEGRDGELTRDGRRGLPQRDPANANVLAKLAVLDQIGECVSAFISASPKHKGMSKTAATHEYGCSCFIDAFVRTRCTKQIDLTLVALPSHPIYRELGDSVFSVTSPMLRNLIVAHCLTRAKCASTIPLNRGGAYVDAEIDMFALRGTPHHIDSVLADRSDLRQTLEHFFGKFSCWEAPKRGDLRVVHFNPTEHRQRQHVYSERVARILSNTTSGKRQQWVGEVLGERVPWLTYEEVLAASKSAFKAPANIISLSELAWHRGKLSDPVLWRRLADWMPGVVKRLLAHTDGAECDIDLMMSDMLAVPINEGRAISLVTEKAIVEELLAARNWRAALARVAMSSLAHVDSLLVYQHAIVTSACMMAIAYQLSELVVLERRGKLAQPKKAHAKPKVEQNNPPPLPVQQKKLPKRTPKLETPAPPPPPPQLKHIKTEPKRSPPPPAKKAKKVPSSPPRSQRKRDDDGKQWVTIGSNGRPKKQLEQKADEQIVIEKSEPIAYTVVMLEEEPERMPTYDGDVLMSVDPPEPLFDVAALHAACMPDEFVCEQNIWQALTALPPVVW